MVKENTNKGKKYYQCDICELYYKEEKLAKKCEQWCSKHPSCNIEIIKNSVKI